MKISTIILLLAGGVLAWIAITSESQDQSTRAAGLAADAPVPTHLALEVPAGYVARVFDVEGMCCMGCPRSLYEKVIAIDGVAAAAASFDEQTVAALVPADFSVASLESVLDSDKYTATLRE